MYTYWPYPTYSPYFDRFYNPYAYCPCCGRPWQNPYMTTATWSDTVSYGRPFYYGDVLKEQEKAA